MKQIALIINLLILSLAFFACGSDANTKTGEKGKSGKNPEHSNSTLLVTVKKLSYESFDHYFMANGTIEAVEDAFISPEINGQIKTIQVKEGQRVKKNQLLISLNADIIKNTIAEVKANLELAKTVYKKREGLWNKKIGSEIQYLEAKTNKESLENRLKSLEAQLEMSNIKAPISGIVDDIFRKEGELAIPGMQLLQLVNLKEVFVNADVSENYLAKIKKGDPVTVTFSSYPELKIETIIYRIGNVIKSKNRTFLIQLLLDNPDEKLKPNMVAMIKMKDYFSEAALVIPAIIIKNDLKGSYVYVAEEKEGKKIAVKTYITPGLSEGNHTMVDQGLQPGQQVIVKGYHLVKNGMTVKIEEGKKEGKASHDG